MANKKWTCRNSSFIYDEKLKDLIFLVIHYTLIHIAVVILESSVWRKSNVLIGYVC